MNKSKNIFDVLFPILPDREEKKKMTVGEAIEYFLLEKGCPDDVVKAITGEIRTRKELRINEFWNKEYRSGMIRPLAIAVNTVALEYLIDNFPDAWFTKAFCPCDQCTGKEHKGFE